MALDTTAALVVSIDQCVSDALELLNDGEDIRVRAARSILSSASTLLSTLAGLIEPEDIDIKVGTDNPGTCGHPETFDLPGQKMCVTCGASETDDGWRVL